MRFSLALLFGARGGGLLALGLAGRFALSTFRLLSLLLVLILLRARRAARFAFRLSRVAFRLGALAVFLTTFPAPATTLGIRSVCCADH